MPHMQLPQNWKILCENIFLTTCGKKATVIVGFFPKNITLAKNISELTIRFQVQNYSYKGNEPWCITFWSVILRFA